MAVTKRIPFMQEKNCQVLGTESILGKKWAIVLVQEIFFEKSAGFNKIKKALKKISPRILSKRLKELEQLKLVSKKMSKKNNSVISTYSLTGKGKELQSIVQKMKQWGIKWSNIPDDCLTTKCSECKNFFC